MIDYGFGVMLETIEYAKKARIWRNESCFNRFFRQPGLISEKHHENWLQNIESSNIEMFSILKLQKDGDCICIGVCGLTSIDYIHRKAEISCYTILGDSHEEQEKDSLKTITHFGFNELNLNRIWAETFETHKLHLDILDELGFKREGVLRQSYYKGGKYTNSIIHAMLAENWKNLI